MEKRFWAKVARGKPAECWFWTGTLNRPGGYGWISNPGGRGHTLAHRYSYMLHFGEIPEGMRVLHRCDVPLCVNPAHLFIGTQLENMRDAASKGRMRSLNGEKTHCKHGHPFTPENTRLGTQQGGYKLRICLTCYRERIDRHRKPPKEIPTHCIHGHEYTSENTWTGMRGAAIVRHCKTCRREQMRQYTQAKRSSS